jgi:hypothetical protein
MAWETSTPPDALFTASKRARSAAEARPSLTAATGAGLTTGSDARGSWLLDRWGAALGEAPRVPVLVVVALPLAPPVAVDLAFELAFEPLGAGRPVVVPPLDVDADPGRDDVPAPAVPVDPSEPLVPAAPFAPAEAFVRLPAAVPGDPAPEHPVSAPAHSAPSSAPHSA